MPLTEAIIAFPDQVLDGPPAALAGSKLHDPSSRLDFDLHESQTRGEKGTYIHFYMRIYCQKYG